MKETRFLLSKELIRNYFLLIIPLTFLFLMLDQVIIVKSAIIFFISGILYSAIHKLLFKYIFRGGPNVSSKPEDIKLICELDIFNSRKKVIEIGSGNGYISIELAKKGMDVTGIDINPFAVLTARALALLNAVKCKFIVANMWAFDYSKYDVVVVYCIDHAMGDLKIKLINDLKPNSYIVSNYFKIPGMKENYSNKNIFVYKI